MLTAPVSSSHFITRLFGMSLHKRKRPSPNHTGPSDHRKPVASRSTAARFSRYFPKLESSTCTAGSGYLTGSPRPAGVYPPGWPGSGRRLGSAGVEGTRSARLRPAGGTRYIALTSFPEERAMSETPKLLLHKDGPIGWIIFNQPEKRNAVSLEMWQMMPEYVQDLSTDDAIRVVVLRGAGDQAFVAGADISQFKERRRNMADQEEYARISSRGQDSLGTLTKPLLSILPGHWVR